MASLAVLLADQVALCIILPGFLQSVWKYLPGLIPACGVFPDCDISVPVLLPYRVLAVIIGIFLTGPVLVFHAADKPPGIISRGLPAPCLRIRKMSFVDLQQQGFIPTYTRNKLTNDLHDICGFRTDYQFISKSKMKGIQN